MASLPLQCSDFHFNKLTKRNNDMPKIIVRGSSSSSSSSSAGSSRMLFTQDVVEQTPVVVIVEQSGDVEIYTGQEANDVLEASPTQEK